VIHIHTVTKQKRETRNSENSAEGCHAIQANKICPAINSHTKNSYYLLAEAAAAAAGAGAGAAAAAGAGAGDQS